MTSAQSPLFESVLWEGNGFRILDEISLPEQIRYISARNVSQAINAVREMKTRAFGRVLYVPL
jgi:methylthioribose-1-phosphate isomerase